MQLMESHTPFLGDMVRPKLKSKGTSVSAVLLKCNFFKIATKVILASSNAKPFAIQLRGPSPNGKNANVGYDCSLFGLNLSGSNLSGFGQYSGLRWSKKTGTLTLIPFSTISSSVTAHV